MIILTLIVAGLVVPFMLIYAPILMLMWLPIGSTIAWLTPRWQRLPLRTRRRVRRSLAWTAATVLWLLFTVKGGWGAFWNV